MNYNGTPTLLVSNGTFTLNNNSVTVTVLGSALSAGSYKLVSTTTGGTVGGSVSGSTLIVNGAGAVASANLQISGGELYLVVLGATTLGLSSSSNPSGFNDALTFTNSILTNGVIAGTASGTVIFQTNGVAFSTNSLSGGTTTSLSITNLPRGTNVITANYTGDNNYLGSTNSLLQVVTNHPPVAIDATYYRAKGTSLKIAIAGLFTNVTDVDADLITLQSVGAGTNGATVLTNSTYVFYLPGTGASSNSNDTVSYTVSDGFGGSATANILVNVYSAAGLAQLSMPTNGVVNITFFGIPNYTYVVQTTTNLTTAWWILSTNTAGTNGSWLFTDPNATNTQQYYRSAQP